MIHFKAKILIRRWYNASNSEVLYEDNLRQKFGSSWRKTCCNWYR